MNNLLARFFKKKTLSPNSAKVSTVVMFDPMLVRICGTAKTDHHANLRNRENAQSSAKIAERPE